MEKSKAEYLNHLTHAYIRANKADSTEQKADWQKPVQAQTHCSAIQDIIRDVTTEAEYEAWVNYVSGAGANPFVYEIAFFSFDE